MDGYDAAFNATSRTRIFFIMTAVAELAKRAFVVFTTVIVRVETPLVFRADVGIKCIVGIILIVALIPQLAEKQHLRLVRITIQDKGWGRGGGPSSGISWLTGRCSPCFTG